MTYFINSEIMFVDTNHIEKCLEISCPLCFQMSSNQTTCSEIYYIQKNYFANALSNSLYTL